MNYIDYHSKRREAMKLDTLEPSRTPSSFGFLILGFGFLGTAFALFVLRIAGFFNG